MLNVPVMGLPALAWLRSFAAVPIHGHRGGLAASMRHPGLGVATGSGSSSPAWPAPTTCTSADCGSKFYETDDEVAANMASLLEPLGNTILPLPTLSSGQNVTTPGPTYQR